MRMRVLLEPHHGAGYDQILALARAAGEAGWPNCAAGADTVYFHLYDVTDLDHVRLLGREILTQLS